MENIDSILFVSCNTLDSLTAKILLKYKFPDKHIRFLKLTDIYQNKAFVYDKKDMDKLLGVSSDMVILFGVTISPKSIRNFCLEEDRINVMITNKTMSYYTMNEYDCFYPNNIVNRPYMSVDNELYRNSQTMVLVDYLVKNHLIEPLDDTSDYAMLLLMDCMWNILYGDKSIDEALILEEKFKEGKKDTNKMNDLHKYLLERVKDNNFFLFDKEK